MTQYTSAEPGAIFPRPEEEEVDKYEVPERENEGEKGIEATTGQLDGGTGIGGRPRG